MSGRPPVGSRRHIFIGGCTTLRFLAWVFPGIIVSIVFEYMHSHISTLPMRVNTSLQAYRVGIADYLEALTTHLYMLTRVILPIGPLREFEKD